MDSLVFNSESLLLREHPYIFADLARQDRSTWPAIDSEWLFIWEALDRVGRAKFPQEWDGEEFFVRDWEDGFGWEIGRAKAEAEDVKDFGDKGMVDDAQERIRSLERMQALFKRNENRLNRVNLVAQLLADKARGALITCQAKAAGESDSLPDFMHQDEWGQPSPLHSYFVNGGHIKPENMRPGRVREIQMEDDDWGLKPAFFQAGSAKQMHIFMLAYDIEFMIDQMEADNSALTETPLTVVPLAAPTPPPKQPDYTQGHRSDQWKYRRDYKGRRNP